jgi:arylsulfatase A-like enzyme
MKRFLGITVALVLAIGATYIFRIEIALQAINIIAKLRTPVGPHQEVAWSTNSAPVKDHSRPNIILIVADDLGWNDLTLNGGGVAGGTVPTPNINAIAEEGVAFSNGYAAFSSCAPSRAALMSGRYPTRFGFAFTPTPPGMLKMVTSMGAGAQENMPPAITHFDEVEGKVPDYEDMGMPASEVTLAETLKAAGYHTAHIGKWHLGRNNGMAPHDQGFDESLLMHSGLYLPEKDPDVVNAKQDFDPIDRFLWQGLLYAASFNGSPAFKPGGYVTDYYTDEAVKVIANNRERPFFLYLAHWAPHTPLQATRADYDALSHIKLHRERVYAAMIRALDRGVGQVMQALRDNGIDDNTLVIFTSDNGGAGYIGIDNVNSPFRGFKLQLFEGGIHVPFMMRWPGQIAPATTVTDPVQHFDIYATAAAAAGASVDSERLDGVDLLPYIDSDSRPATPPHETLFWLNGEYQVVLSDGWKLQKSQRPDTIRLFNMAEDPTERHNVAAENPERAQKMLSALASHVAQQPPPAWPAQLEVPQRIDEHSAQPWSVDAEYVYVTN